MAGSSDDLLAALGQLQGHPRSSATEGLHGDVDRVRLLAAVLASAQGAGLTPEQTAELMRGLGIIDGPETPSASTAPPNHLALAPEPQTRSIRPARAAPKAPLRGLPGRAQTSKPPASLPPVDHDLTSSASTAAASRDAASTAPPMVQPPVVEAISVPPADVAADESDVDADRSGRRPFRRVSAPARLQPADASPRVGGSSTQFRIARPATLPVAVSPSALVSKPAALKPAALKPSAPEPQPTMPLPSRIQPSAPQPAPAAAVVDATDTRVEGPIALSDGVSAERSAHSSTPPSALVESAARALADSLEGLASEFQRVDARAAVEARAADAAPTPTRTPTTVRSLNASAPARMLDVDIEKAPPFTGSWTWHDTNIRSALRGTLPALLMHWVRESATHRVELLCGRARGEFVLVDGRLVGVRTNIAAVQLGKVLVDRARIPPREQSKARALRTPRELAVWASRTGLLTPNQMHEVRVAMMRASLSMCLAWPGGTFRVFRRPAGPDNQTRLQVPATLLGVVDAVPVQLALNCLEQMGPFALLRGPRIEEGAVLSRDPICGVLMNRRPASTPLAEVLRRLNAPTLDAARRVVLLTEMEILAIGDRTDAVGALEIRRKPSLRTSVGLDVSPLADRFKLSAEDADTLTRLMLQACLVHLPKTDDATVDELVAMARMAVSRDARPAGTTETDRKMLQAFTARGLSVPDMCEFCAQLVDWLGLLGVDLHRLVPSKSVLGVVLYTKR